MLHAAAEASEHLNQIFSVAVENLPGAASHSSMKLYALAFALHMQSPPWQQLHRTTTLRKLEDSQI